MTERIATKIQTFTVEEFRASSVFRRVFLRALENNGAELTDPITVSAWPDRTHTVTVKCAKSGERSYPVSWTIGQ